MKRRLCIIGAWLWAFIGCQCSTPPQVDSTAEAKVDEVTASAIVDHVIAMGFLKYVPESERSRLRGQLVESVRRGYLDTDWDDACNSADLRGYDADNEDLAEGDIGKCILAMRNVLAREGVRLTGVEDDYGEQEYVVVVNGQRHPIYTSDDATTKNTWGIALKRLLEIVNGLLERAGSKERLYGVFGGNEGRIILLTPEMHEYLRSCQGVFDNRSMPFTAAIIQHNGSFTLTTD
jgi:hypothetical protein